VISRSPTDLQPVLQAVGERSAALCRAYGCRIWLPEENHLRSMTGYLGVRGDEAVTGRDEVLPLTRGSVVGRAFADRRTVHVQDVTRLFDSEYPDSREPQIRHGFRTVLAVPMVRDGASAGIIAVMRRQVQPF
jgi:GAF domain-containing protein